VLAWRSICQYDGIGYGMHVPLESAKDDHRVVKVPNQRSQCSPVDPGPVDEVEPSGRCVEFTGHSLDDPVGVDVALALVPFTAFVSCHSDTVPSSVTVTADGSRQSWLIRP